jgi:hypothetical protein
MVVTIIKAREHEPGVVGHYPLGLYLIHVGDALQATLLMALILGARRRDAQRDVQPSSATFTSS